MVNPFVFGQFEMKVARGCGLGGGALFVYKTKDNKTVCACACATHRARDRELQVSCNNMTHKIPHNMLHTHTHRGRLREAGREISIRSNVPGMQHSVYLIMLQLDT